LTISHDSFSHGNDLACPGAAADTSYGYNTDSDLTGLTHAFVAGTGRDAAGKMNSIGINQPAFEWMPTLAYGRTYGPVSNRRLHL
jgi:hypothetical protein